MKRADVAGSLNDAFDRHLDKLIDVLFVDLIDEPNNQTEVIARFHRGLIAAVAAHDKVSALIEPDFKE